MTAKTADDATVALRPEPIDDAADRRAPRAGQYRRLYRIAGRAGQCLVQRVCVRIRYAIGNQTMFGYRQSYAEFFSFEESDGAITDVHDFHYHRDGWSAAVMAKLCQRYLPHSHALHRGTPTLRVSKRFLLAPGEVTGTAPHRLAAGGAFGILDRGPGGPRSVALRVMTPGADAACVTDLATSPRAFTAAGRGRFTSRSGWRTTEHLHFDYATNSSRTSGANRYVRQALAPRWFARA